MRGWGRSKRSPAYVRLHTHSIADMLLGSRCPYVVLAERIIGKQVRVALPIGIARQFLHCPRSGR